MTKKRTPTLYERCMQTFKNNSAIIGFVVILLLFGGIALFTGGEESNEENQVYGDDRIDMYYFYLSTCPHCQKQEAFHDQLKSQFPNLKIHKYEITSRSAMEKYREMAQDYPNVNNNQPSTPTTFIGNQSNVGYGSDATTGQKLISMIQQREQEIMASWDEETMVTTEELRAQQSQQNE